MQANKVVDSIPRLAHATFPPSNRRSLAVLLDQLVNQLARVRDQDEPKAALGARVARSVDDDFVYLEGEVVDDCDMEADICIHDGRVFIRLIR
jgi:hypothetical protein